LDDDIYRTAQEKFNAIVDTIEDCYKRKQPVLVGTVSIEKSELIAKMLQKKKIPHNVLNAKQHSREANIIAQAGHPGAVTIATNMAGRGTDIMLGGNSEMLLEEASQKVKDKNKLALLEAQIKEKVAKDKKIVIEAGGLYVLGTERHESRRVDNQLRGRSGRQGDAGVSKFFLSFEDDLMRIFASDRLSSIMKMGFKEGQAMTDPMVSRAIEKAQQRVESHNFDIRRNLLKFDDVMNDQRKVIYAQRIDIMDTEDVSKTVRDMRDDVTENIVNAAIPPKSYPEQWDTQLLEMEIFRVYGLQLPVHEWAKEEGVADKEILERLDKYTDELMADKQEKYGESVMRLLEKRVLLVTLDQLWKEHLLRLDHLRQGIGLRAYGQKDPLNEYKREAFAMFEEMLARLNEVVTTRLAHMELSAEQRDEKELVKSPKNRQKMKESRIDPALTERKPSSPVLGTAISKIAPEDRDANNPETWGKVARNENCPCGSGKKYKQCHGSV